LTIGIHAGSSYHHAVTGSGWPTHYMEDYAAQSLGFGDSAGTEPFSEHLDFPVREREVGAREMSAHLRSLCDRVRE